MRGPIVPQPKTIYCFVSARPGEQFMAVAVEADTWKTLEATILPTKQRAMLALGFGNDDAHSHHTYRRAAPQGYDLVWIDDPTTDERLAGMRGEVQAAEPDDEPDIVREPEDAPLGDTDEVTAALVRAGAASAATQRQRSDPGDQGSTEKRPGIDPTRHGGISGKDIEDRPVPRTHGQDQGTQESDDSHVHSEPSPSHTGDFW